MPQDPSLEDNEIDLRELFAVLWAHKILISLFTGLSILLAGNHALTTQKKFTANAIFQIEKNNNQPEINMTGELGALASLAGFSGTGGALSGNNLLIERFMGREFIIALKTKFSIDQDPYFNQYNPDQKDPFWKATIKEIIGWQKTELERNAVIESNVLKNYRENVFIELTDGGAFVISVTHSDPQKAAYYANNFMEEIRQVIEKESEDSLALRLNYLSETLADALQETEAAQKNLKNYALKNSAMAEENFISDSLKIDQMRMDKRRVEEIANLLSILENFIKSENLDSKAYEALRSSHPIVDDIDFRRILGMSETISAWTWPDIETIDAVSATLKDRIKRLDVNIANIEENARIYAASAEVLAKYKREAKIAEATYTVLIEQVKSKSLAAGFQPESFKVFEYAVSPLTPSSPKRKLIILVGAALGIFIGSALAVINSIRKNVYYTKFRLLYSAKAKLALKSKPFWRLARRSISELTEQLSKRQITALSEANLKLANNNIIYVINSGGRPTASNAARLLAAQSAQSGKNVVLLDTTGQSEKAIKEKITVQNSSLPIQNINDNFNIIMGMTGSSFFTSKTFNETIKELAERFDQVFICTTKINNQLGLTALLEYAPGLVMIAGLRKTTKSDIKAVNTKQPIDLLFYD